jgi:hypothetical protein
MALTAQDIASLKLDDDLYEILSSELERRISAEEHRNSDDLVESMKRLPRGLRAMAATYDLDVSMALDSLGCHFVNNSSRDLAHETRDGLKELEAAEAAQVFAEALALVDPYLDAIGAGGDVPWEELERGLEPLNERMWAICQKLPNYGLLQYWLIYARKYPERIVG